ncbi:MAG: exodeoxyribonuclease VII large subunit, partial [Chlamydiia bacterium]|nr:exodeoxyribonuclease VII large subunit [Chlamydiia bacterium]
MKALSVTELTSQIKQQLETGFSSIYVKGEISNIKLQASGHYYFT